MPTVVIADATSGLEEALKPGGMGGSPLASDAEPSACHRES